MIIKYKLLRQVEKQVVDQIWIKSSYRVWDQVSNKVFRKVRDQVIHQVLRKILEGF
jgi:hypothetical protein